MKSQFKAGAVRFSAITLVAMLAGASANAVEWNGYFRAGPGDKATTGDKQGCFSAQGGDNTFGHGGVGRLGNECETYGEFTLSQGGKIGNIDFKTTLMTNFYGGGSDIGDSKVGVTQIYTVAKGFDFAPDQTFWVGKRYGNRAYVYYDDYFPINMTGTGAGVDDINVGSGNLELAVYRDGDNTSTPSRRFNADLRGLAVNPGGTLRITGSSTSVSQGASGLGLSLPSSTPNAVSG
jgi:maltoporin